MTKSPCSPTRQCRLCGCSDLKEVIDFGFQAVANHFHSEPGKPIEKLPLRLIRCESCDLVQLSDQIDMDIMYRNYWYRSGVNDTMREHLRHLAEHVKNDVALEDGDVIIDIGSNDGTFLSYFPERCVRVGVDPSNVESSNCVRVRDYFTEKAIQKVLGNKKAKIITSIAMFYDVNDPKAFVRDVQSRLADDGVWIAELSYLPKMLSNRAYDSICHEHVAYYRLETFQRALEGSGFDIFRTEINDMNGSSFRVFMSRKGIRPVEPSVMEILSGERLRFVSPKPYEEFKAGVEWNSLRLLSFLDMTTALGKTVYGYGASTKGQVILQFCSVTPDMIKGIAERNSRKYGLYTPATDIPICSEDEMRDSRPDFLLIFPWYFLDEFLEREKPLRDQGTKIVVPLPTFHVIR